MIVGNFVLQLVPDMMQSTEPGGGKPTEAVNFYYGVYDAPVLRDGLNLAESWQLGLDYDSDPTAFEEVVRFQGKYIDEIESLVVTLKTYQESATQHQQRETSYRNLREVANGPDEITQIALRGAGAAVLRSKETLRDEMKTLLDQGETFSRSMTAYFAARLPDTSELRINGVSYGFWEGVLTVTRDEGNDQRVTIFASEPTFRDFAVDNYKGVNAAANTIKEGDQYGRVATPNDWQTLIDGLNLTTKY